MKIKIILKFLGTGYYDYYQAYVKIYDSQNNLLYQGSSFNGIIELCLKKGAYRIMVILGNQKIITTFYVNNHKKIIFNLNQTINDNLITFQLTDYNYRNLPIMKGEMFFG